MVLLFNVYLTNSPANASLNLERGTLPYHSKVDVTKYSLASLAVAYKWTRAIINVEFADEYKNQIEDFTKYVYETFKGIDLIFSTTRNTFQQGWIKTYDKINDEVILYLGNHDHIFLDSSTEYLEQLVEEVRTGNYINPTVPISHWPENIRWAKSGYIDLKESTPRRLNDNYKINPLHISYNTVCIDSLIILTKSLYKEWFLSESWKESFKLPRTEGVGELSLITIKQIYNKTLPFQTILTPYRELFRHFDGYMHQLINNNICPSLTIPKGFFESNIKIRCGYTDYLEGWININPKTNNYRAYSLDGIDYKLTPEDFPLIWKDKVAKLDINPYINEEEMIQYRLKDVLSMMYSDVRYNAYLDPEVEEKVLNQYLKTYKQYQLK